MKATTHNTLVGALGLQRRDLVALVGGGGKTSALLLIVQELAAGGSRVVATTTTAMFRWQLAAVGPLLMEERRSDLEVALRAALEHENPVGVARGLGANDKIVGVPPDWADELWVAGLTDYLIVEADGSKGRSLKFFGSHEPQVPAATTTVLQIAGLDALGASLSDEHVHRADLLASALQVPVGSVVTHDVFLDSLREQLRVLAQRWPAARIITMLNKADAPEDEAAGMSLAMELLAATPRRGDHKAPEAVVVVSMRGRHFVRMVADEND